MSLPKPAAPFILVDGSSYLFRAYHALPPLTTPSGQPTGAIYGAIQMFKRLMADYHQPTHIAVVFDSKEKNFRHQLLKSYKANRTEMPDELAAQIGPLQAIIRALGIPLIIMPGVEADDIIGTLAHQAQNQGFHTYIVTNDKDMAQLVNDRVSLVDTMKNRVLGPKEVFEKFSVQPDQMIDYLSLIGDSVDNIKGIPKVGPKTAAKWLAAYKNIPGIFKHIDEISGKVKESLIEHKSELSLYRQLVTILTDVDVTLNESAFHRTAPEPVVLQEWSEKLAFKPGFLTIQTDKTFANGKIADSPQAAARAGERSSLYKPALLATRAGDITQYLEHLLDTKSGHLSLAFKSTSSPITPANFMAIACFYADAHHSLLLEEPKHLRCLVEALSKHPVSIVCGDSKTWFKFLRAEGVSRKNLHDGNTADLSLMSYLLNSTASRHDMKTLVPKKLGHEYPDELGERAQAHLQLYQCLSNAFSQAPGAIDTLYHSIELPLSRILAKMEMTGILIDADLLKKQGAVIEKTIAGLEQKAFLLADMPFNLNSPKQLQEILFERQGLPILEKTPKGQPSTGESVLQELALEYPLPQVILDYRTLAKLKSTYIDTLPQQVNPNTGRIHTTYHQIVTATGRLSSSDPNLQNIPIRGEEGRKIRRAFIAAPGYTLVSADYSQIELRLMAHFAQDPGLIQAFTEGHDIHQHTAAEVFRIPLTEVDSEMRRRAKAINFGLLYGMSGYGLSKQLSVRVVEADSFIDRYFTRFPRVRTFMEDTKQFARTHGYVESLMGRRLYLPEINARQQPRRRAAERAAINAPLQSTSADIIKQAMIHIDAWLHATQFPVRMLLQVHDELVFEVKHDVIDEACRKIKASMENACILSVDLKVDVNQGKNWDEAH
jgi:DNA polymerase-1